MIVSNQENKVSIECRPVAIAALLSFTDSLEKMGLSTREQLFMAYQTLLFSLVELFVEIFGSKSTIDVLRNSLRYVEDQTKEPSNNKDLH